MTGNQIFEKTDRFVHRQLGNTHIAVPLGKEAVEIDDIINFNETAQFFLSRLDGKTSLDKIAADLAAEYDAPVQEIIKDLKELSQELLEERMICEKH